MAAGAARPSRRRRSSRRWRAPVHGQRRRPGRLHLSSGGPGRLDRRAGPSARRADRARRSRPPARGTRRARRHQVGGAGRRGLVGGVGHLVGHAGVDLVADAGEHRHRRRWRWPGPARGRRRRPGRCGHRRRAPPRPRRRRRATSRASAADTERGGVAALHPGVGHHHLRTPARCCSSSCTKSASAALAGAGDQPDPPRPRGQRAGRRCASSRPSAARQARVRSRSRGQPAEGVGRVDRPTSSAAAGPGVRRRRAVHACGSRRRRSCARHPPASGWRSPCALSVANSVTASLATGGAPGRARLDQLEVDVARAGPAAAS